jgi:hypothetical protein
MLYDVRVECSGYTPVTRSKLYFMYGWSTIRKDPVWVQFTISNLEYHAHNAPDLRYILIRRLKIRTSKALENLKLMEQALRLLPVHNLEISDGK